MKIFFNKKIKIAAEIVFLSGAIFWASMAKAQQNSGPSISIAPHTFDLSAEAGNEIRQKIKIYNRSDTAIPIRIRVAGFDAEEETGDMVEAGSENQIISWFQFDKQNFIVDPGKTERINFSVRIPEGAQQQGYYAVIFLEADISTYLYNESKLQVIPGLGIPFMLKVGNEQTAEPLAILEYSISEENRLEKAEKALNFLTRPFTGEQNEIAVIKSGEPSFVVRLKNNSSYHTKLSGKIKLSGLGWKLNNKMEFPPITILPGRTRRVLVENLVGENEISVIGVPSAVAARLDSRLASRSEQAARLAEEEKSSASVGFGLMKANLDIESDEGIRREASRWIFVFSWWLVFLLLAVLTAVVSAVLLIRRRKSKKNPNKNLSGDLYAEEIKPEKTAGKKSNPSKKQPEEKKIVKKIRKKPPGGKRKANNKKN